MFEGRIDRFGEMCLNCAYYGDKTPCANYASGSCVGCPMHYVSTKSYNHCHCLAHVTRAEEKTGVCKFYKEYKFKNAYSCTCTAPAYEDEEELRVWVSIDADSAEDAELRAKRFCFKRYGRIVDVDVEFAHVKEEEGRIR